MPRVSTLEPPAPFPILDRRRSGQAMSPVPLKLPPEAAERLQATADQLGISRTALIRDLVLEGMERRLPMAATTRAA